MEQFEVNKKPPKTKTLRVNISNINIQTRLKCKYGLSFLSLTEKSKLNTKEYENNVKSTKDTDDKIDFC